MAEHPQRLSRNVDVVVIGAGPAGSTAAAALARAGRSVLVLERRSHPRFHVGESMLPPVMLILEEIGALDLVLAQGYVVKHGAEFSGGRRGRYGRIPFSGQGPGRQHTTFQAERAHFDRVLCQFAQGCGANVVQDAPVRELVLDGERVVGVRFTSAGVAHTVWARYVIDAGGRSSKISQTFGLRKPIRRQRMVAVYQHLGDLDERNNPGVEGDLQIGNHADGWVWAIPLWPDKASVGAVMPRQLLQGGADPHALFTEHVSRVSRISQRIAGTRPISELKVETDYLYYSDQVAGPGWYMAGDAACFFDPIFSGGVFLAMITGQKAAEAVDKSLSSPQCAEEWRRSYSNFYKTGYDTYARLVYAYYDANYSLRGFLRSAGFDITGDELGGNRWVARLVSGDFWNDRNVLVRELHKRPAWNTFAPFELAWGCPFYDELNVAEAAVATSAE